jgi:GNAT superfamily N-acetyltransferase
LSTPHNWSVRAYREGDENQIFELWEAAHPERQYIRTKWLKWWNWMYKKVPDGSNILLADDNGKLVGLFCVTIRKVKIGNDIKKAAHSLDTLTHPDYRRQGIMLTLSKATFDELAKQETNIIYGFPNEMSYPNDIRLGFLDVGFRQKMIRIINWESFLKRWISNKFFLKLCALTVNTLYKMVCRSPKPPVVKDLAITQVSCFDERINEFCDRVSSNFQIMVLRNKDYLSWKYTDVPDLKYSIYIAEKVKTICGYLILRYHREEFKKKAQIYDFLAESEEVAQSLLHVATENCRRDNIDYIYWAGIANKAYLRAFRKRGFISQPTHKEGRLVVYSSSPNISKEFLKNPQNWLSQLGDSDDT